MSDALREVRFTLVVEGSPWLDVTSRLTAEEVRKLKLALAGTLAKAANDAQAEGHAQAHHPPPYHHTARDHAQESAQAVHPIRSPHGGAREGPGE